MWPKIDNNITSFLFTPTIRAAALFCPIKKSSKPFRLVACTIENAATTRYENIEYNPHQFKSFANSFVQKNNTHNAFVSYALSHHGIIEELVQHHTSTPHAQELCTPSLRNTQWDCNYICPSDNGQFIFYRVGIPRPLLFQYQLLATVCSHNLIQLTTQFGCHFALYRYLRGSAFRQNQLAYDIQHHTNQLRFSLDPSLLWYLVHIPHHLYQQASTYTEQLTTLFGLYLSTYRNGMQKELHETY